MFRRLVECTGQGIGWADLDGNIVYMNPSLRRMLDLAQDVDVSGRLLHHFRPADATQVAGEMLSVARDQGSWSGEVPLLSELGRVIPTRHDIHLLRDDAGTPIAFGCVITDLSQHKRHEQSLRESKSKYRALVENIPQRVFYKDQQSRYLAVNRHYANDRGVRPQDVIGKDDYALTPRDLADKYRLDDQRIMATGLAEEYDEAHDQDGKRITVHTIKTPVKDEDGQVIGICGIYWDVSESQRAREALTRSEALLAEAQALAHLGNWNLDLVTGQAIWSDEEYRLLGYAPGQITASVENFQRVIHPDDVVAVMTEMQRTMTPGESRPFRIEHRVVRADADNRIVRIVEQQGRVLFDDAGQPLRMYGTTLDVSEQRRVESALRAERNFTGAVLDNAGALLLVLDREGRIRRFNRACEKISGYCFTEVEGRHPWDILMLPEERDRVREHVLLALTDHSEALASIYTNHWQDKDGGKHLLEWHKAPLLDEQGRLEYMVSIGIDVTEKHAVEAALLRSEETYARAEAITHIGSWDWDILGGGLRWTDEVYRIFGLTPQSCTASYMAFLDAIHPDDRQKVIDAVNASVADANVPYSVEHRVVRPDGEVREVIERGKVYQDDQGNPIRMIGSVHDISERKQAERELERYRSHLEVLVQERTAELGRESSRNAMIVNTASDGFFTASQDGRVVECNDIYCRMLGYSRKELLQLHIADIEADESPEDMADHISKIVEQGRDRFDTRHRCKDGSLIHVEVNVTMPYIGADRFLFAFVHDISARKADEAALMRARDEAERANQAKSEFLSRMSHELRTPLNAILGFGQLLKRANLGELQTDNVGEILHAGRHLLELINEVLDLARIESGKLSICLEPVPLLPLLNDCLGLIRPQAENSGIELGESAAGCDESVLADQTRLKQVLLNLLSNAVKYNRPGGRVDLTCKLHAGVHPNGAIQISISDTGPGLCASQQALLFTAFERLGAESTSVEGTGIGLALSKRLMELMGGEIGVESTPGSGTTFWLRLPLAQQQHGQAESSPEGAESEAPTGATLSKQFDLLCIEDNPANMRLVERILALRTDIRLLKAGTPGLGLELARVSHPALILLDINLPEMDGFEVLRCLRENPLTRGIPVIGISANAMPKDVELARAAGFDDYLTKPLDIGQFLSVVERNLDSLSKPEPQ